MEKATQIIAVISFLIIGLSSCKPPKDETRYSYRAISSELNAYVFKVGSYWVYQDSSIGTLDTQSLYSVHKDSSYITAGHPVGGPAVEISERVVMLYKTSLLKDVLTQQIKPNLIARYSDRQSWCTFESPGQWIYGPISEGDTQRGLINLRTINQLIDNSNVYNNLKVFRIIANKQECYLVDSNTTNYFCPNKGIIRYEVDSADTKKVWKLIDSHLIF